MSPSEYWTEHLTVVGLENLGRFVIVADVIKLKILLIAIMMKHEFLKGSYSYFMTFF